jgi:hypothetical protein
MTLHRFDVIFQSETLLPEDHQVNTWHFDEVAGPPENFDNVRDMLEDFYVSLESFFAGVLFADTVLVRAYDMTDSEPRAPVYESAFDLAMGSGEPLPPEVSLCISFQAAQVSGLPQARRRNRKYLPTFTETSNDTFGRPNDGTVTNVAGAGSALLAAANASASWHWVINSPTSGENPRVDNGWVDNSWDTQRRRGRRASSRTAFTDET